MKSYTFEQEVGVLVLDGLDSRHKSGEKKVALQAIEAGMCIHQMYLNFEEGTLTEEAAVAKISQVVERVKKLDWNYLLTLEQEISGVLLADGAMDEVPDLLACDIHYDTAGVDLWVYRSDRQCYLGISERLRADVLEEGDMTWESACMLWLLRESGCMYELFSVREQDVIAKKMIEAGLQMPIIQALWQLEFHNKLQHMIQNVTKKWDDLFQNQYLQGVALLYPFLDRRKAIFIDFVVLNTTVKERRLAILNYLTEHGHYVEEVKNGTETILRIDNMYYRVFPKTIRSYRIPIQGAALVPMYQG